MQSYTLFKRNIRDYSKSLNDGSKPVLPQIQKIFSSPRYIDLEVRRPGRSEHVLLGRGGDYSGFWTSSDRAPSDLRIKDKFVEFLRSRLRGRRLIDVRCANAEAYMMHLLAGVKDQVCILTIYIHKKSLYFLYAESNKSGFEVFVPWGSKLKLRTTIETEVCSQLEAYLLDVIGKECPFEGKEEKESFPGYGEIENDVKALRDQRKRARRKVANIEGDLQKIRRWKDLSREVENSDFPKPTKKIKILGIKFNFIGLKDEWAQKNVIYEKIKRLKKIEPFQEERLLEAKEKYTYIENEEAQIFKPQKVLYPKWKVSQDKKATQETSNEKGYEVYKIPNLGKLAVGLSPQGNDQLRKLWAKKDDIWFHLDGLTSAHCILKVSSNSVLAPEFLDLIASVLAEKSGHNSSEIPIIYTQVKNIKGVTGTPGKVIYKKEKHVSARLIENWRENISLEEI